MAADIQPYLDLVTSEHADKPKFMATLAGLVQPLADLRDLLKGLPQAFDLDTAIGVQLDTVGQWIGPTRRVSVPIPGAFFSFDIEGLGFDQGQWYSIGDSLTEIDLLADDAYRLLLKARAVNNAWDGSIPQAYAIWDALLEPQGYEILIFDNGDLTMGLGLVGTPPDPVLRALFVGGYLDLRPAGVRISEYLIVTAPGPPFALDAPPPASFAGLDTGVWTDIITP